MEFKGREAPRWIRYLISSVMLVFSAILFYQSLEVIWHIKIKYYALAFIALTAAAGAVLLPPVGLKYLIRSGKIEVYKRDKFIRSIFIPDITKIGHQLEGALSFRARWDLDRSLLLSNLVLFTKDTSSGYPVAVQDLKLFVSKLVDANSNITITEGLLRRIQ